MLIPSKASLALVGLASLIAPSLAWTRSPIRQVRSTTSLNAETNEQSVRDKSEESSSASRRKYFTNASLTLGLGFLTVLPQDALADDRLFRPNPLTNKVLEQFRIWDQAEADQIQYGGELERGDAKVTTADQYAKLLVPILRMSDELTQVDGLIHDNQLAPAQTILSQPTYNKIQMKKVFNSNSDNVYYSDPDRANVYLAGGAVPNAEQSLAYLLRNEVITAIENMQAEVDYVMQHAEEPKDDLYKYSQQALASMQQYLKIIPPHDIAKARELMK